MLVEIVEGFFCDPKLVAVVKETGSDECALFMAGASAVDGGFTLPYAAARVAKEVNAVRMAEDGDEDEEKP